MSSSIADPQASLFEAKKELPMLPETMAEPDRYLQVSFGYKCNVKRESSFAASDGYEMPYGLEQDNTSFSCLSGAALSANATLANTNICNGLIGAEILPTLDSPKSFRRVSSSPSFARLDFLSSSLSSGMSTQTSPSSQSESSDCDFDIMKSMSAPSRCDSFLNIMEVEVAGGAAGEDRVQAFCSEENGWVFCSIYDGFNGRDAADYLAGTLYKTIAFYLSLLDKELKQGINSTSDGSLPIFLDGSNSVSEKKALTRIYDNTDNRGNKEDSPMDNQEVSYDSFKQRVLESLEYALSLAENDFLCMVEQEMEDRPDLVSIGSCALVVLLYGRDLFTLNLGDSRAVLARYSGNDMDETEVLEAIQLTEIHTVDNEHEREQLVSNHPNDPTTIVGGRVKGKLKLTRAFGVGYLKKRKMNDALMGILQVRNLLSPPYISTQPSLNVHRISKDDCFVIIGSDGLFDFFNNDEAVKLVHTYILSNPSGDPAKFLLEQLLLRAADSAGISTEELMRIPAGRRRKYHDDVTVIVIILGSNLSTSKASTFL